MVQSQQRPASAVNVREGLFGTAVQDEDEDEDAEEYVEMDDADEDVDDEG